MHSTPLEAALVMKVGPQGSNVLCCSSGAQLTHDLIFAVLMSSFCFGVIISSPEFSEKLSRGQGRTMLPFTDDIASKTRPSPPDGATSSPSRGSKETLCW